MPQDAAYRKYTEQLVNERFGHVNSEPDVEKLEKKINCGQIEEVIFQVGPSQPVCSHRNVIHWVEAFTLVFGHLEVLQTLRSETEQLI